MKTIKNLLKSFIEWWAIPALPTDEEAKILKAKRARYNKFKKRRRYTKYR